ncbi:sulfatase, partial [bacterium]|nr:sulfatase [bacterium]
MAATAGCARGPSPGDLAGWNVLLVTIDTLRSDRLGFEGWTAADTPVLDRLAAGGVVFRTALATAPVTLPSHASILTGLYPPRHGALDNGIYSLPEGVPTLATILKDAGYATSASIGAYVLHRQYGLARGFDVYDDRFRHPSADAARERRGAHVVDRAIRWLRERDHDAPFFLWAHLYDPHAPYSPPAEYAGFADPYDGEIAYVDACIGALLDALREEGSLARTLVVVTADHGEAFGDGGERTHGLLLRESTLRVPWILRAKGALPGGREIADVVSGADVAPTVLALLGLPVPAGLD